MNNTLRTLIELERKQEDELKIAQTNLEITKQSIRKAVIEEHYVLRNILKENLLDIIRIIESHRNLKVIRFNEGIYTICGDSYEFDIRSCDQTGEIILDDCCFRNDGGGTRVKEELRDIIKYEIIPYCERKKLEGSKMK